MARAGSLALAAVVAASALGGGPAVAQIQLPNIFDALFGPPPRPPADIPGAPPSAPQRSNLPQPRDVPPPQPLPPGSPPYIGPRDDVRSEPLPPPPGAVTAPPSARLPAPSAPGQPSAPAPGQPRGNIAAVPPQPEEVITEPPPVKIANPTAVFAGLDKITGRITTFEVAINETVRFGALEVTPRACYTRPPTETANTDGFVEVDELTLQGELRRIFTGWMFASSPGLNAVEHPIYDVWLTDCKGGSPPPVAEVTQEPPPAAPRAQPPRRSQPQRRAAPVQPPQQQPR